jgi:diguanylate cyclase (GGDEF)-like protein
MPLDYDSLLLAVGFAGAGLALTMFGSWLTARADQFLLTWSIGVTLIVAHVVGYSIYVDRPRIVLLVIAFALLASALSVLYGAAQQFRGRRASVRTMAALAAGSTVALLVPAAFGLDGLADVVINVIAAALLLAIARQYWLGRAEAPTPIVAVAILYALIGLSFALCAVALLADGRFVLNKAPDNWTEDLNLFVAIVGMTGIGALSLALNQWRLAGRHRHEALTDALTGLLNRRALLERVGTQPLDTFTAVLLFDLDRFKGINDRFGHATGDEVLRRFAMLMGETLRGVDVAARLGGEEFVAVLYRTTPDRAHQVGERIRKSFAEMVVETGEGELRCTVSVGIAFATGDAHGFEQVLSAADRALYRAKQGGRNRISSANLRLAG